MPKCSFCEEEIAADMGVYNYNEEQWYHISCDEIVAAHDSLDGFQNIICRGAELPQLADETAAVDAAVEALSNAARIASAVGKNLSEIATSTLFSLAHSGDVDIEDAKSTMEE